MWDSPADMSLINKSYFALDINGKWLAGTGGTDFDNIMMQMVQCFLYKESYRKNLPAWLESGCKVSERVEPIEIEAWVPSVDKPGCLKYDHTKTIGEIEKELVARLKLDQLWMDLDYFHFSPNDSSRESDERNQPFPKYRWIACYAVTGDSEGHYIHVDVIYGDSDAIADRYKYQGVWCRRLVFLGKTFAGFDKAWEIARACSRHLAA